METCTVGGATEGNCATGSVSIPRAPRNRISSEMTIASAGRWRNFVNIEKLVLFGLVLQVLQDHFRGAEVELDVLPVAHLPDAFEDDLFPRQDALLDYEHVLQLVLNRDFALMHHVVLADDEHVAFVENLERRPLGNDDGVVQLFVN